MALARVTKQMREEATCSICLNLMVQPMSISCGHSFCQQCLSGLLSESQYSQYSTGYYRAGYFSGVPQETQSTCPQCRAQFPSSSLRPNTQLGSLIEVIRELRDDLFCKDHCEQLRLFCNDDDELICWCCERAAGHRGHSTELMEDAHLGYKEKLQGALTHLRQLEQECRGQMALVETDTARWNEKVECERRTIQSAFQDVYSLLRAEEKSYLGRLDQEKEEVLRTLRDNKATLERTQCELSGHIQELDARCQASAQTLLQGVKAALRRSQEVEVPTPPAPSLEISATYNVSALCPDVERLLSSYRVSVTPDSDLDDAERSQSEEEME